MGQLQLQLQLLTGLRLYQTAQDKKFFDLPMQSKDVEFSYLTTALNYGKINDWLGLSGRDDFEMPSLDQSLRFPLKFSTPYLAWSSGR